MRLGHSLARSNSGASAVEFALALPLLVAFIIGIAQLGFLFFANADVRNAVAAGARLASVYPRPGDAAVIDRINQQVASLDPRNISGPTVVHGTDANGNDYADIEMRYSVPLDFIFFRTPPVTLVERRRVFTQPEGP